MNFTEKNKSLSGKEYLILLTAIAVNIILLRGKIHADIWNDEMYTLKNFVLVPFITTIGDYHVPNNHILFSILERSWLQLSGNFDLGYLIEHPHIARVPSLCFSCLTIIYTYLLGRNFFDKNVAVCGLILLISTLPFFNFACQIRGYSLTVLLTIMLIYYAFNSVLHRHKLAYVGVCISTAFLLYTIPSNFYIVFSFLSVTGIALVYNFYTSIRTKQSLNTLLLTWGGLFTAMVSGVLLSCILYYPVLHQLFNNRYTASRATTNLELVTSYMPRIFFEILSERALWLVVILVISVILFLQKKKENTKNVIVMLMAIFLFLLPFIMGFYRGDIPPGRLFVFMIPIFITFAMAMFKIVFNNTHKFRSWLPASAIAVITILSIISFNAGRKKIDEKLYVNVQTYYFEMGLYNNYFDTYFEPNHVTKHFLHTTRNKNPIVVLHDSQPHDMPYYLEHYRIKYYDMSKLDSLMQLQDSIYVVTIDTAGLHKEVSQNYANRKTQLLADSLYYHNFVLLYNE